jgi:hypothetical protein
MYTLHAFGRQERHKLPKKTSLTGSYVGVVVRTRTRGKRLLGGPEGASVAVAQPSV